MPWFVYVELPEFAAVAEVGQKAVKELANSIASYEEEHGEPLPPRPWNRDDPKMARITAAHKAVHHVHGIRDAAHARFAEAHPFGDRHIERAGSHLVILCADGADAQTVASQIPNSIASESLPDPIAAFGLPFAYEKPPKTQTRYDAHWDIEKARTLIEPLIKPMWAAGFFIGIAGSVFTKGKSDKDLDLVLAPLTTAHVDLDAAKAVLKAHGWTPYVDRETVTAQWRKVGSLDEKHVEVWLHEDRRVDVFFLK